jgi:hypothetical protein
MKGLDERGSEWLEKQTTPGLRMDSTKLFMDDEVKRIVRDSAYRDSIFRQPYTFVDVARNLAAGNFRLAFYNLIDLYPKNKATVLRYVMAYDAAVPAEKFVAAAYYTYAMLDPRITKIVDGKPDIYRPDIMEELFHNANEITAYVLSKRR